MFAFFNSLQSLVLANCDFPCSSEIYCHGELLHTLQTRLSDYFGEAKEFVDRPMINSESPFCFKI